MDTCGVCGQEGMALVAHNCKSGLEQRSNPKPAIGVTNECIQWLEQRITELEEKLSDGLRTRN
jgi:hypothetical protein